MNMGIYMYTYIRISIYGGSVMEAVYLFPFMVGAMPSNQPCVSRQADSI